MRNANDNDDMMGHPVTISGYSTWKPRYCDIIITDDGDFWTVGISANLPYLTNQRVRATGVRVGSRDMVIEKIEAI